MSTKEHKCPNCGYISIEGTEKRQVIANKFKELQDKIEASYKTPIRLEKTMRKTAQSLGLERFLEKFFREWNNERNTIFFGTEDVQTEAGKRRSIGDIYMICKYYYPECTLEDVIRILYITLPEIITEGFRSSFCHTIEKKVWYFDEGDDNGVFDKTHNDEYGNPYRFYLEKVQ